MKITKKQVVIGIAVIILIGIGFVVFGGIQSEDSDADIKKAGNTKNIDNKKAEVATVKTEDGKEITVDSEGNEVKINKDGSTTIVKKNAVSKTEAKKAVASSNSNKNTANSNKNTNKNTANSDKNTSSSGSSNSGSSSSGSSNSGGNSSSTSEKAPAHVHDWQPFYNQRIVGIYSKCGTCGADITGFEGDHAKEHNLKGENGGFYDAPRYETYLDGWECSICGAWKPE